MAAILVPAVQTGAALIADNLPSMVKTVEAKAPGAFSKLKQVLGMSKTDPKKAALDVKKSADPYLVQGLVGNMIASGVPRDVLRNSANGLISDETWDQLFAMYRGYESLETAAVDHMTPVITRDSLPAGLPTEYADAALAAMTERDVNELCAFFGGISREALARMHTKFMALTSKRIAQAEIAHRMRVFGHNDPRSRLPGNWGR